MDQYFGDLSELIWLMVGCRNDKGYQDLGVQNKNHQAFSPDAHPNLLPQSQLYPYLNSKATPIPLQPKPYTGVESGFQPHL